MNAVISRACEPAFGRFPLGDCIPAGERRPPQRRLYDERINFRGVLDGSPRMPGHARRRGPGSGVQAATACYGGLARPGPLTRLDGLGSKPVPTRARTERSGVRSPEWYSTLSMLISTKIIRPVSVSEPMWDRGLQAWAPSMPPSSTSRVLADPGAPHGRGRGRRSTVMRGTALDLDIAWAWGRVGSFQTREGGIWPKSSMKLPFPRWEDLGSGYVPVRGQAGVGTRKGTTDSHVSRLEPPANVGSEHEPRPALERGGMKKEMRR